MLKSLNQLLWLCMVSQMILLVAPDSDHSDILVHHIVQDASSMRLFYEDLDRALSDISKELRPHVDYKAWADSLIALRDSPAATASVVYYVKRLSNLHHHKQALYPPARAHRQAITESPDGLEYGFDAPVLLDLKTSHPGSSQRSY